MADRPLNDVVQAVRRCAGAWGNESELHERIGRELATVGEVRSEVRLSAEDRIDFLTDTGIGVELKVDGTKTAVLRQLARYAQHDIVSGLVLATTRSKHLGMPAELGGKPLAVVHIIGGSF